MGKSLGKEYTSKIERVAFLKDNCDACENKGYMKIAPEIAIIEV